MIQGILSFIYNEFTPQRTVRNVLSKIASTTQTQARLHKQFALTMEQEIVQATDSFILSQRKLRKSVSLLLNLK